MKLCTTTGDFERFCPDRLDRLRHIREAGFRYVDLSLYSLEGDADLLFSPDYEKKTLALREEAERLGLTFLQAHSPGGNPLAPEQKERLTEATVRSIEICSLLDIPNIVVHSGASYDLTEAEPYFAAHRPFYDRLVPVMEKTGVSVLAENTTHRNIGNYFFPVTGKDLYDFCEYIDHPLFHACWDTGHANCEGVQYDHIMTIGHHLRAVHINDNRGGADEHLVPFFGTVNMDDVMCALIDVGFSGPFTFESSSNLRPSRYWLGNRHPFARESRLVEPTLEMQRDIERLLYHVGKHILSAYGCFEN